MVTINTRRRSTRAVVVLAIVLSAACSSESSDTTSATSADVPAATGCVGELGERETRRYRDDVGDEDPNLVSLDVYRRPGAVGCPMIIWVHGGGWRAGDKAGKAIATKAEFAGELGAALVSVNYRLVTPDLRWPVMGEDVAAAVAWVIEQASELGIDRSRIALMGHSAGAHLVSIVATDPALLAAAGATRDDVGCVVSLDSAAYDITAAKVRRTPLYASAFGEDPATLAAASPTVQAREHPDGLPDALVVTRGAPGRVVESEKFAEAVGATADAGVVDAGEYTHEQVNTALGKPGEAVVTPPTRVFLERCFE